MFNIGKSLQVSNSYSKNFPFFSSLIFQFILTFIAFEFIRQELPEIKFLQLIPGYYFLFIFFLIILFFLFNSFFIIFPSYLDSKNFLGTKSLIKSQYFIFTKFFYISAFIVFFFSLNSLIPSQFDTFYSYTEKNFENFWSFEEFFNLQTILLSLLLILSQLPILIFYFLNNHIKILQILQSFKLFLFVILFLSGVITPTVDLISQLLFSLFAIFFYLFSIHFLLKRISIKYLTLSTLE